MKLFRNRTLLGITCIIIALVICFAIVPLINSSLAKKITVVRLTKDVKAGEELKRNMLVEIEVGNYNLPENIYHSIDEVNGMFLTMDVCAGDYLFPAKVSEVPGLENTYLYQLDGSRQAISITIDKFARGLSGKLKAGDIVSVLAPDYEGSTSTVVPAELQYIEVIAVTADSGYDANVEDRKEEEEEKELPGTVTVLVSPEQAKILAQLEADGIIHLSLAYRGSKENASKFLEMQDKILEELKALAEESEDAGSAVDETHSSEAGGEE